ncbi:cell division control protein 48 homolog B-like [Camellia sinensis]|uniref:cell division control protein 48 homolog B-like n=1 Tax=Camellia sinensis TaxID=4442 RepID=UPI0010360316|nr:cell division control protein 48 homolog B-like [Camellia sinensis]
MEANSMNIDGGGGEREWKAEEAIAGNGEALQALRELITFPLLYSRESHKLGLQWPRGLLLYGPPGTGKTSLVRAVVRECDAHLTVISPHSVHRAYAGESERILREAFAEASSHAKSGKPSVIFIDEIDALCPRRDSRKEQDIHVASQLFMLMDSNKPTSRSVPQVVVVASTDSTLHLWITVTVTQPNVEFMKAIMLFSYNILQLYTKKFPLDPSVDLQSIAASCNGYVGADLEALRREAAMSVVRKSSDANEEAGMRSLTMDDWKHARSVVGPSITRGVTVEIPKVSWEDIGGLKNLKKKLQQAVKWPLKHSAAFSRLGVSPVCGILLHGPPGCSKTTLAQASFFSLSGAELYSMYVGEGEALLHNTFQRARLAAPSIIFFDEADVVAAKRGGKSSSNIAVGERLLSTLLTEMDDLEQAKGILVLAATNRPLAIDAALMRPGRFDLVLYVPPPDLEARYEILSVHTRNMKVSNDVDLKQIAEDTELFTGAELEGLCREAGIVALREDISASVVCNRHFQTVWKSLKPALTTEEVNSYSSFMKNPSLISSGSSKASAKQNSKHTTSLWGSVGPVSIGILSFILLAGVKYFFMQTDRFPNELATT